MNGLEAAWISHSDYQVGTRSKAGRFQIHLKVVRLLRRTFGLCIKALMGTWLPQLGKKKNTKCCVYQITLFVYHMAKEYSLTYIYAKVLQGKEHQLFGYLNTVRPKKLHITEVSLPQLIQNIFMIKAQKRHFIHILSAHYRHYL